MKPERHKAFNPAQIAQHVDHGNNPTHQAGQDKRHNDQGPFGWKFGNIADDGRALF